MNSSLRAFAEFSELNDYSHEVMFGNKEELGRYKLMRVLIMRGLEEDTRRECIGKLIHLRFLSVIDGEFFGEIPNSIKNLRKLLHLEWIYNGGRNFCNVPNDLVGNMENLRALVLPLFGRIECENYGFGLGLSGCKKLQCLESGASAWMMKDLPILSPTVQSLAITEINKTEEIEAIYLCPSITEGKICSLELSFVIPASGEFDMEKVRHCKTLWNLDLTSFSLVFRELGAPLEFPSNLVKLYLSKCEIKEGEYHLIRVLGELSNLKILKLSDSYSEKRLTCKANDFPQLQELELVLLPNLKEWLIEEGAMARLTKLTIRGCRDLQRLSHSIRSIATLKEFKAEYMSDEFCKRLEINEEDYYIIQHIPVVIVSRSLMKW